MGRFGLMAFFLLSVSPSPAEAGDPTGRIVFAYEDDVWVMNADGSERMRLTSNPAAEFDAAWSPDGTRIAYRVHLDSSEEVFVMNADGSGQVNLTNDPGSDYSPAWSPDGIRIAFASNRENRGGNDIWIMDSDGDNPRRVTSVPGIQEYPSWSPDGTRIAFACTFGRVLPEGVGDFEICVVDADGNNLVQLTEAPGESKMPAWSPDGKTIAFVSNRHGWPSLPGYTPPGYDEARFGDFDVYLMAADGSGQQNLTDNSREDDSMPAWSPDGQWLAFSRYGCTMLIPVAGGPTIQLTPGALCADVFPDWTR